MEPGSRVFPMQLAWRACLWLLAGIGAVAAVLCAVELLGLVERGRLVGDAGDPERIAGLVVGLGVLPFAGTALRHARFTIGTNSIGYLGLGFVCRTKRIPLADVRRHGSAVGSNRGRRERMLVLELQDRTIRTVKLAMYDGAREILALLEQRLGPAAAASATMAGVRFDSPE